MVVTWDYMCAGQGNKQVNSSCVGSPPASGLLITRGRVPLRRKLGLSPSEGGHPEFPKKSELKGWGRGGGGCGVNAIMCRKRIIQICARNFETLKMIHFRAGIRALRGLLRLENGGCFMSIAALVVEILMRKVMLYQQQFNTKCDNNTVLQTGVTNGVLGLSYHERSIEWWLSQY